jgi:hypothetical protein
LHPLWYTPILPIEFFVSAIALGLGMVAAESLLSAYLYERPPEWDLIQGLGRICGWVLGVYALLRVGDLAVRGQLGALFSGTRPGNLLLIELLVSSLIPGGLLLIGRTRRHHAALVAAAALTVIGFVLNRLDVGGLAMIDTTGTRYAPSWMEIILSVGIVAGAALVYLFLAEHARILHSGRVDGARFRHHLPEFDRRTGVVRPDPYMGGLATNSLMVVLGGALALGLLPGSVVAGRVYEAHPVARVGYAPKMVLGGDRTDAAVLFDHQAHVDREGGANSCGRCHHLLKPGETATGCSRCHRDMFQPVSIFDHELHQRRLGGSSGCAACHTDDAEPKDFAHGRPCLSCHTRMVAAGTPLPPKNPPRLGSAPGYVPALHGLCVGCHQERAKDPKLAKPHLGDCATCHKAEQTPMNPMKPDERWPS